MIILEGANGVGKTTYAKALSEAFGVRTYRAFRPQGAMHHTDARDRLETLGVPANTYVEDMYIADMARVIDHELILDRSLPSAIAYEMAESQMTMDGVDWVQLMFEWELMLGRALRPVLVVHLVAPYYLARTRMTGSIPSKSKYELITEWTSKVIGAVSMPKIELDTSEVRVPAGVGRIIAKMETLCQQTSNRSEIG